MRRAGALSWSRRNGILLTLSLWIWCLAFRLAASMTHRIMYQGSRIFPAIDRKSLRRRPRLRKSTVRAFHLTMRMHARTDFLLYDLDALLELKSSVGTGGTDERQRQTSHGRRAESDEP